MTLPAKTETLPIVQQPDPEPQEVNQLLRFALEKNVPVETIERLTTLYERMADRKARDEFNAALTAFQGECPSIPKNCESGQFSATRNGVKKATRYSDLDQIAKTIRPYLLKHGLSYNFDQTFGKGELTATCKLRHIGGHVEPSSFRATTGSNAGASEVQKEAAALSYAKRYALLSALGLTSADPDTDGAPENGADPVETYPRVSLDQVAHLEDLMMEVGQDIQKFLVWAKAERLEDVEASLYAKAVEILKKKRRP